MPDNRPLVCFLQNAWSPVYAGGVWPRASWLRALARSWSGRRLSLLLDDLGVCHNTTPLVGAHPDASLPPDPLHIRNVLAETEPQLVIACGLQAEVALAALWP